MGEIALDHQARQTDARRRPTLWFDRGGDGAAMLRRARPRAWVDRAAALRPRPVGGGPLMRILTNTTSPYARIARVALGEKGFDLRQTEIVNPWADDGGLLALNPAARVPTLQTDSGLPLTESLLVLLWLERKVPSPSLLDGPLDLIVSQAGRAMGIIDAMANIVTGTLQMDPNWGETPVGLRRRRSIVTGLRPLEADPPAYAGGTPNVAVITAVVAFDYLRLRFPDAPWVEPTPNLEALARAVADRPAFAGTRPFIAQG